MKLDSKSRSWTSSHARESEIGMKSETLPFFSCVFFILLNRWHISNVLPRWLKFNEARNESCSVCWVFKCARHRAKSELSIFHEFDLISEFWDENSDWDENLERFEWRLNWKSNWKSLKAETNRILWQEKKANGKRKERIQHEIFYKQMMMFHLEKVNRRCEGYNEVSHTANLNLNW